jgi:predicted ester cyclase
MMRNMIVLVAALAFASTVGCGGKTKSAPTGAGSDVASGSDMGSGAMNGSDMVGTGGGSAVETKPAPPPPPPPPPPKTQDEIAARYQECWGLWNDGKYDDFKGCYASDATSEDPGSGKPAVSGTDAIIEDAKAQKSGVPDMKGALQLVLVNGNKAAGVAVLMGTNTEALKTPMGEIKPSKKKVGAVFGHLVEFNDAGAVTKQWGFYDIATLLGQIGASKMPGRKAVTKAPKTTEVVLAKNDDKEKANLASFDALTDAFNKHDVKALGAALGDKVVWSEVAAPGDQTKKQVLKDMPLMWKGFSDLTFNVKDKWAAGDYVVAVESFDGTNDGDLPMMKLKKTGKKVSTPFLAIHKFENGKNTATWIFYQGIDFATQLGMMPGAK